MTMTMHEPVGRQVESFIGPPKEQLQLCCSSNSYKLQKLYGYIYIFKIYIVFDIIGQNKASNLSDILEINYMQKPVWCCQYSSELSSNDGNRIVFLIMGSSFSCFRDLQLC